MKIELFSYTKDIERAMSLKFKKIPAFEWNSYKNYYTFNREIFRNDPALAGMGSKQKRNYVREISKGYSKVPAFFVPWGETVFVSKDAVGLYDILTSIYHELGHAYFFQILPDFDLSLEGEVSARRLKDFFVRGSISEGFAMLVQIKTELNLIARNSISADDSQALGYFLELTRFPHVEIFNAFSGKEFTFEDVNGPEFLEKKIDDLQFLLSEKRLEDAFNMFQDRDLKLQYAIGTDFMLSVWDKLPGRPEEKLMGIDQNLPTWEELKDPALYLDRIGQ